MIPKPENLTHLVREVLSHHILEVSRDPMFLVDGDRRILIANRAAERLGWDDGQLVGRCWDELIAGGDTSVAHIASSNVAVSAPGVATARQATLRLPNGSVEAVRLVTYRLWLGSGTAPSVMIVERRHPEPAASALSAADTVDAGCPVVCGADR